LVYINPISGKSIPIIVTEDVPYRHFFEETYVGYGARKGVDGYICNMLNVEVCEIFDSDSPVDLLSYVDQTTFTESDINNLQPVKDSIKNESSHDKSNLSFSSKSQYDKKLDTFSHVKFTNCGKLSGLNPHEARKLALEILDECGTAPVFGSFKLKDWLVSRQRYWGTPIPMIWCPGCGTQAVPADMLPVRPPPSPSSTPSWSRTTCHRCGNPNAVRETETLDTFVDSCWYFLRYADPNNLLAPFSPNVADPLLPIDVYIGGEEHAARHLFYARFMMHFLHSVGMTNHQEPFSKLLLVGVVTAPSYRLPSGRYVPATEVDLTAKPPIYKEKNQEPGNVANTCAENNRVTVKVEKMSKSKHNGVDPLEVTEQWGTDVTRLAMLRAEESDRSVVWRAEHTVKPAAALLHTLWRVVTVMHRETEISAEPAVLEEAERRLNLARNYATYWCTRHYERCELKEAIQVLEQLTRDIRSLPITVVPSPCYHLAVSTLLHLLAPITPHLANEMWAAVADKQNGGSLSDQPWPKVDEDFTQTMQLVITVNGGKKSRKFPLTAEFGSLPDEALLERLQGEDSPMVCPGQTIGGQTVLRWRLERDEKYVHIDVITKEEKPQSKTNRR